MRVVRLGGPKVRKARRNAADAHEGEDVVMYRDSSAAHLLDLRRRFKAVMDVLDAMIRGGVSLARSVELTAHWDEILGIGPVNPVTLEDFRLARSGGLGEFRRVAGDIHCGLSEFIHRVVVHRRDEAIRGWRNWIREDPMVHTCRWLRPDLVPPAPFLQCKPHLTPGGSGVLSRIDEKFRKAGLPYFCRSGQRETSLKEFNEEVDGWLPLLPVVSLPELTGSMLEEVVRRKSATAGSLDGWGKRALKFLPLPWFDGRARIHEVDGWLPLLLEVSLPHLIGEVLAEVVHRKSATAGSLDGWGWREMKFLPVSWFDGLARILTKVEETGTWPEGLLDAYIAMIHETDGDATPLGQRPQSVLPVVYRFWASSARMVQLDGWFRSWNALFDCGYVCRARRRVGSGMIFAELLVTIISRSVHFVVGRPVESSQVQSLRQFQLLALPAGMWGRLFGALCIGTGPGVMSTGT